MTRGTRTFAIVAGSLAVLLVGSGLLLAATVAASGLVTVQVHEKEDGRHFYLPVPAAFLHAGIAFLPLAIPAGERAHMRAELDCKGPALAALFREIERCPDAVLVDVLDHGQSVRFVKEGRTLTVRVRGGDADVDVSLPVSVLTHFAHALTV
ncbi:MAG TPA: hypothetical protein VOA87_04690 [Thermoanaerobaculia bacterium]|nr:hypothetical protein [Thermoanaerobaculia bacterium]